MSLQAVELHSGQEVMDHARIVHARIAASRIPRRPSINVEAIMGELSAIKAERDQYRAMVVNLQAENVTLTTRLERFTNRLTNLQHEAVVAVDEAEHLSEQEEQTTKLSIERIIKITCEHFKIGRKDLIAARRTKEIAYPRHIAMHVCREITIYSLPRIGRMFGGRDHTTVHHAHQKILEMRRNDPKVEADVKEICARVIA